MVTVESGHESVTLSERDIQVILDVVWAAQRRGLAYMMGLAHSAEERGVQQGFQSQLQDRNNEYERILVLLSALMPLKWYRFVDCCKGEGS